MVTTICYGEKREWKSREDAKAFFLEGVMCSEGSEKARYTNVYIQLEMGANLATDEEE